MSSKISRRNLIKMLAVAGGAFAVLPYVGKASAFTQPAGSKAPGIAGLMGQPSGDAGAGEPLFLVVKGEQILGLRGMREMPINNASLAATLNNTFASIGEA